ncbi:periplasmic nitrate reductase, NapE protein [Microbulbifer sp. SA54]|uniref:periplasmic nitrate reductase, NapE protein n=1 Tax=Microbulbifer sp. SA54 TaxID=3401577 RepID=UPI003AAB79D3
MAKIDQQEMAAHKRREGRLVLFILVFLFPLLAVAIVGGYGFFIWIMQMIFGPPGPPA